MKLMRDFGEENKAVKAFTAGDSTESSSSLRRYLLDAAYLGGLCFALPYLAVTGKARRVLDHVPRRSRDLPTRTGKKPCLWVHGVSVGEVLSVRQLLRRFSGEFSEWDVVMSTTTRAGIEVGQKHYPDTPIVSYPFDLSYLVRRAFDRIRPDLILIVEHELWPNFLWHAQARRVPVVIVNGRMSERSLRGYQWLSKLVCWPPPGIIQYCVEDSVSAEGYRRLGVAPERIHVTGNLKFDNVASPAGGLREELGLNGSDWVLVAASTHLGEEEILLNSFSSVYREDDHSRLILAPRNVERVEELTGLVRKRGFEAIRWSQVKESLSDLGPNARARDSAWQQNGRGKVVIVDTMGELDRISTAGDVVFVGGSLVPFGGHNVIAPAGMGRPVVIGPHYANFRSVVAAFIEHDALLVAKDPADFTRKLHDLKRDPAYAGSIARRASETVASRAGASDRTLEVLRPIVERIAALDPIESARVQSSIR